MPLVKRVFVLTAMLVCTAIAWAQNAPTTALSGLNGGDLTTSYVVMVKSTNFDIGYQGADVSTTKYFTKHLGFRAEADFERMNTFNYREYGFRGGPVYKFKPGQNAQPYVQYLIGYAQAKGTIFPGPYVYHGGLSMLGGGGVDYRLKNGWFARGGLDFVADNNKTNGLGSKYARVTFGLSYHIADCRQ